MSTKVGEVYLEIGAIMGAFEKALVEARVKAAALEGQFNNAANNMSKRAAALGKSISDMGGKFTTFATLPILGAAGAMIKYASDTSESLNKVNVSFGDSAQSILDWSKTSLSVMGLSKQTALDQAALYGDMATSMGISQSAAAEMSKTLVQLGADMASFKNVSVEQASTALKGIFTGEGEALKGLSVIMLDSTLEAYAMEKGITTNYKAMSQAEKVALRYKYVLDSTKNSQGDFKNTAGGAANQMRMFSEGMKDLAANFGSIILPAFTGIILKVNEFIQWLGSLDASTKNTILVIAGLVAVVGPVLMVFGKLISTYAVLLPVMAAVKAGFLGQAVASGSGTAAMVAHKIATIASTVAMKALNLVMKMNPIGAVIALAVALVAVLYKLTIGTQKQTEAEKAAAETKKLLKERIDDIRETSDQQLEFTNSYVDAQKRAGKTEREIISDLQKKNKELDQERQHLRSRGPEAVKSVNDIIGANNRLIGELKKSIEQQKTNDRQAASAEWLKAREAATKKWIAFNEEYGKTALQMAKLQYARELQELEASHSRRLVSEEIYGEAKKNLAKQYEDEVTKIQKEQTERRNALIGESIGVANSYVGQLGSLFSMYYQNQIAEVENAEARKLDELNSWYESQQDIINSTVVDEKTKNKQLEALDKELARREKKIQEDSEKEKRKLQIESAKREKAITITETIMTTAQAAMNSYAWGANIGGPVLGAILAGITTAFGVAKVALIASQPLPQAAEGIYAESPYIGGEAGPELAFPLASERGKKAMSLMSNVLLDNIAKRQNDTQPTQEAKTFEVFKVVGTRKSMFNELFSAMENGDLYVPARAVV